MKSKQSFYASLLPYFTHFTKRLFDASQIVTLQPFAGGLANTIQATLLKGAFQACVLQQLGKDAAAALTSVRHVVLPSILAVFLLQCPDLECNGLC